MELEEATQLFQSLSLTDQSVFLLRVSHALSIMLRDAYPGQASERDGTAIMVRINEAQHRVAAHVLKIMLSDQKRYPDNVLFRILYECAPTEMRKASRIAAQPMRSP